MCLGVCIHTWVHARSICICYLCAYLYMWLCVCMCASVHVCGMEVHLMWTLFFSRGPVHLVFGGRASHSFSRNWFYSSGWPAISPACPLPMVWTTGTYHTLGFRAWLWGMERSLPFRLSSPTTSAVLLFARCLAEITKRNYRLPACSQRAAFSIQMYLFVCPEFNLKNINSCQRFKFRRFCIII